METLDSLGRRYGVRPSDLVGEGNPFVAVSIDLWAHNLGIQRENQDRWRRERERRRG